MTLWAFFASAVRKMMTLFPEICKTVRRVLRGKPKHSVLHMASLRGLSFIHSGVKWRLLETHFLSGTSLSIPKYVPWQTHTCINLKMEQKRSACLSKNRTSSDTDLQARDYLCYFQDWQHYLYSGVVLLGKFLTLVQFCLISLNFCKQLLGTKTSQHFIIVIIITERGEHLLCSNAVVFKP